MPDRPLAPVAPVRKEVFVPVAPEVAFRRFTAEVGHWWPLRTHSVGGEAATAVSFEGHVGGRLYETLADGSEETWGRISVWAPPGRVVFTWHPGRGPEWAQEVEVRFRSAPGGTLVTLEHRGWEVLGSEARETRDRYDSGWEGVLAGFVSLRG